MPEADEHDIDEGDEGDAKVEADTATHLKAFCNTYPSLLYLFWIKQVI